MGEAWDTAPVWAKIATVAILVAFGISILAVGLALLIRLFIWILLA